MDAHARLSSSGVQKRGKLSVESFLIFDVGEMRSVQLGISSAWNVLSKKTSVRRGCRGIVRSRNHKSGFANLPKLFAEIEIANGSATGGVAALIGFYGHFGRLGHGCRRLLAE